jgi:hypothetical protein
MAHGSFTLEQLRAKLEPSPTNVDKRQTEQSLEATLRWLKENLPLSVLHTSFYYQGDDNTSSSSEEVKVWSLDSCTVTIGFEAITRFDKRQGTNVWIDRFTFPMGAINAVRIGAKDNDDNRHPQCGHPDFTVDDSETIFKGGDRWQYCLMIDSRSKIVRLEHSEKNYDGSHREEPPKALYGLWLNFSDESLAKRVQSAFLHAADLCRAREPF